MSHRTTPELPLEPEGTGGNERPQDDSMSRRDLLRASAAALIGGAVGATVMTPQPAEASLLGGLLGPSSSTTIQVRPMNGPMVIIRFDDGYKETASIAGPILAQRGLVGYLAIVTGRIGKTVAGQAYCSATDLLNLAAAGWEIGSHTQTHMNATSNRDQFRAELDGSIKDLLAVGLPYPRSFTYPGGARDAASDREVYWRFKKCFTTYSPNLMGTSPVQPTFFMPYGALGTGDYPSQSLDLIKVTVDQLLSTGRTAVVTFHRISNDAGPLNFPVTQFTAFADWLAGRGYPVGLPLLTKPHDLLCDGGFEEVNYLRTGPYPAQGGAYYSWIFAPGTALSQVSGHAHSGAKSIKFDSAGASVTDTLTHAIPVEPGKTYRVRCWVDIPTLASGQMRMDVAYHNPLNGFISANYRLASSAVPTSGWVEWTATFTPPAGTDTAQFTWVADNANGVAYLDDVTITEDSTYDVLAYGG